MRQKILKKVEKGEMTPAQAFHCINGPKARRANFVKVTMWIRESKAITALFAVLLFLPIPIWFGKYFIKKAMRSQNIPEHVYDEFIDTAGGTTIRVKSKDARIQVYIF